MMRETVSLVMGIIMMLFVLYFAIPLLATEKTATSTFFNQTDTTISTSTVLGNGFYMILPLAGILAGVFLYIAYALRRDALE